MTVSPLPPPNQEPLKKERATRLAMWISVVTAFWILTHVFTISWGLPAFSEQAPDSMIPRPNLSVVEMMRGNTYKYPPLQYLTTHIVLPDSTPKNAEEALKTETTRRILIFRWVCALMELGIVLAIFLFLRGILKTPESAAALGGIIYLLLPVTLFYSHTSNMDIPCTFWFMLSVCAGSYAERLRTEKPTASVLLHLLCGLLIACAFCTKDQVYALYILPAVALVGYRMRRGEGFFRAGTPLFLWGITFILGTVLIYTLAGGLPTFRAHFSWIMGEGRSDFYMTGTSLPERLRIFPLQLRDLCLATDWPLLLFSCGLVLVLSRAGKLRSFAKQHQLLLIGCLLLVLSQQLFFLQATRTSYVRFMIPILPWVCIVAAVFFSDMTKGLPVRKWILFPLILMGCQAAIATQFLWNLEHAPSLRMRKAVLEEKLPDRVRMATLTASDGAYYRYDEHGNKETLKAIRSWSSAHYDFSPYGLSDLYPSRFFLQALDPDVILCTGTALAHPFLHELLQTNALQRSVKIEPVKIVPSFWHHDWETQILLVRNRGIAVPNDTEFAEAPLEKQLMLLSYLTTQTNVFRDTFLEQIGRELKPFDPSSEHESYYVNDAALEMMRHCYTVAGRDGEARKATAFLLESEEKTKQGHSERTNPAPAAPSPAP